MVARAARWCVDDNLGLEEDGDRATATAGAAARVRARTAARAARTGRGYRRGSGNFAIIGGIFPRLACGPRVVALPVEVHPEPLATLRRRIARGAALRRLEGTGG